MMTNIIVGLFGVDDPLRFVLSFPAAPVGMLLAALFIDHFAGRRLWGESADRAPRAKGKS